MSIDPRLAERRRHVAEERARRRVGRLVKLLVALALVGSVVWLFLSPLLSVRRVAVSGVSASSAYRILAAEGAVTGAPMILIRPGRTEAALLEDPWIAGADVDRDWPDLVSVQIEERVPVAWVETEQGWRGVAVDGVVLLSGDQPETGMAVIRLPGLGEGETTESPTLLASLAFVTTLSEGLQGQTAVRVEANGELWAEVAGFQVRLGRDVEMEDKARSLEALLAKGPPAGATINLIAPTHPAVIPPESQDLVEG